MILVCLILLLFSFLFYASYSMRLGVYMCAFCRKQTDEKIVALTFDDGPDATQTPKVLDVLKASNTPATFFCIGSQVGGNEHIIRRMAAEGHTLGNHSYVHSSTFPLLSTRAMTADMVLCQQTLKAIWPGEVTWFRPPFGVTNPTVARVVKHLGYLPIGWNIRTFDTTSSSHDKILKRIDKQLRPGSVILLHDRVPGSERLLAEILNLLCRRGYRVVSLKTMLDS